MSMVLNEMIYHFKEVKVNKSSIIYSTNDIIYNSNVVANEVKIEKYRGFSNSGNINEVYFIKNKKTWKESSYISGLYKTETKDVFYGDSGKPSKNLILFEFLNNKSELKVHYFPSSSPLTRTEIEALARLL